MTDVAWRPTPEYVERANVTRLMRAHGIDDINELRRRSVEDVEWYWDAVVDDLGLEFSTPYDNVLDTSRGVPWATWFIGGRINLVWNCVDRWAHSDAKDRPAIIGESETGEVRGLTFKELHKKIDRVAAGLLEMGVGKGDAVGVFMPIFSGFAAHAVAARLNDAGARALITADGTWRRGKHGLMKQVADEAVAEVPTIERVIVLENLGVDMPMTAGRDVTWHDFTVAHEGVHLDCADTASEDPFMIAYTSGTTGQPKGAVHVHGGFLVKIASEVAYQLDLRAGEVFDWITDMGWIMGPLSMVGAHAVGGTMAMYEGAPDFPGPDRVWASVERHRVNMLGISPTLIRALKVHGDEHPEKHDLSSLRIIGSTGEPWNPEPYEWLRRVAGRGGEVPIINISGGTEVGACFLSPYPVEEIKVCSLGGASLGMDVDVFDAHGEPVRGEVGELVCKQPWPAMTRGIWGDPERYIDTYWSTFDRVWRHGDWARIDEDGQWFLLGRSDDTINVAGKRLGPAEVESVLVSHPDVAESAVVGVPDETKGEAVWWFVVAPGADPELAGELSELVASELVDALPKTRSAKILRRAVRAVAVGDDPGDMSSAENPQALDGIRAALSPR